MISFTTINILGESDVSLNLKKGCYKTLKNIPTVSQHCMRIDWI